MGIGRQFLAQALANRGSDVCGTRGEVVRSRALAGKERLPIIFEGGEASYDVKRALRQIFQFRFFEEAAQSLLRTHGKAARLVEGSGFGIAGGGRGPELAQESCSVCIVPDVNRDRAARTGDAGELVQRAARARNEIRAP